jgi:uncharacterized protein
MLFLACVGLVAGVLSGLLGVGGGLVLVPCLLIAQGAQAPDATVVALATSLATIPFTGSWSTYQQHRLGHVDFAKVKTLAWGVAVGAVAGGFTAALVSEYVLKLLFGVFATYVGVQMLLALQPRFKSSFTPRSATIVGAITGALSSWVGIGGGTIVVPYLAATGEPVKRAIGISSAVGVVVALFSTLGYAWSAWRLGVQVPGRWGFVHSAALMSIVPMSLVGSFLGVRLGAVVSAPLLKRIFGVLLLISAAKLFSTL